MAYYYISTAIDQSLAGGVPRGRVSLLQADEILNMAHSFNQTI